MGELAPLISDLALILICAGIMTLVFKRLKQPLVLGYIVAGFLASPHMPYVPSVLDTANIHVWSDIGVIFLLFALGLEFSVKKLVKVGGTAIISTLTIITSMILIGMLVGWSFGWKQMDCIYLGGMLAMSSTTIIYKAFDDLGIRQQRFAGLVLSILILEDILAIVLMVMLSTVAVSQNFEGMEMVFSIAKLVFFLVLWFVVGIYLIPLFLRKSKQWMSNETLLVMSLGMCFGMVYFAASVGFSAAFGAFIMGSILAETVEAEKIEKLVNPVKDLFGAIFFTSVGMMVDPSMIVEYALPILTITAAILLGQTIFGTSGVVLSGQSLKTAMQCGFSLTQIGEFAFIIASLGVSLKVTSEFLYPIVVAVSVITTFLTPYMIRMAVPAYNRLVKILPDAMLKMLDRYASVPQTTVNHESNWHKLMWAILRIIVVYSVVSIAVITLSFQLLVPLLHDFLPTFWANVSGVVITILAISPFLRALIVKKTHSQEFLTLWNDSRFNRAPLVFTVVLRVFIAMGFIVFVTQHLLRVSTALMIVLALVVIAFMVLSRRIKKQSIRFEKTFLQNFHSREAHQEYMGEKQPEYAGRLLSHDLHLSDFIVPDNSAWAGGMLKDLNFGHKYGVHVVSVLRGNYRINIPNASTRLFPGDKLQVLGTDEQLSTFAQKVQQSVKLVENSEEVVILRQFIVDETSPYLGKDIVQSGIRNNFKCLVVGVERQDEGLRTPKVNVPFMQGDIVWIVGERENIYKLMNNKR